jgi:hypothetical protein
VAVTGVAARDHDTICALFEGIQDKLGVHPGRTEGTYDPEVWLYPQPAYTGKISPCIGAPVTTEYEYFGLKLLLIFHLFLLYHK